MTILCSVFDWINLSPVHGLWRHSVCQIAWQTLAVELSLAQRFENERDAQPLVMSNLLDSEKVLKVQNTMCTASVMQIYRSQS